LYPPTLPIIERNGPGGMKTERRSPMITKGVATPSTASKSITVVITMPASNPATRPAKIAFLLLTHSEYEWLQALCQALEGFTQPSMHMSQNLDDSLRPKQSFALVPLQSWK